MTLSPGPDHGLGGGGYDVLTLVLVGPGDRQRVAFQRDPAGDPCHHLVGGEREGVVFHVGCAVRLGEGLAYRDEGVVFHDGGEALGESVLVGVLLLVGHANAADFGEVGGLDDLTMPSISDSTASILGVAGFEKLLHPGQAAGDVPTGDSAGVEGTHGELRARLADALRGYDADPRSPIIEGRIDASESP